MTILEWCKRSRDLDIAVKEYPELVKDLEERKKKYRVGICAWTPEFLQVFRNPLSFTIILFTFAILEGCLVSGELFTPRP